MSSSFQKRKSVDEKVKVVRKRILESLDDDADSGNKVTGGNPSSSIRISCPSKSLERGMAKRVAYLERHFPECQEHVCDGIDADKSGDTEAARRLGRCLVERYPGDTASISPLGPGGIGALDFESDEECTEFVHLFFSECQSLVPSCTKVLEGGQVKAVPVLGCLFGRYPELMIPLLASKANISSSIAP